MLWTDVSFYTTYLNFILCSCILVRYLKWNSRYIQFDFQDVSYRQNYLVIYLFSTKNQIQWNKKNNLLWYSRTYFHWVGTYSTKNITRFINIDMYLPSLKIIPEFFIKWGTYIFWCFEIGKRLGNVSGDARAKAFLYQRLFLAVPRGNATSLRCTITMLTSSGLCFGMMLREFPQF